MGGVLEAGVGWFSLAPTGVGLAGGDFADSGFVEATPFTEAFLGTELDPLLVGGVWCSAIGLWSGEEVSVLDSRFTIFFSDFMKPPALDLTSLPEDSSVAVLLCDAVASNKTLPWEEELSRGTTTTLSFVSLRFVGGLSALT